MGEKARLELLFFSATASKTQWDHQGCGNVEFGGGYVNKHL